MIRPVLACTALIAGGLFTLPAAAQTAVAPDASPVACPSQQELEQTVNSAGAIRSEGCTVIDVSRLMSDGQELCLIDFGTDQGFIGRLQNAAFPTQGWVQCSDLEAALQ